MTVYFTRHALARMEEREISEAQVVSVLEHGKVSKGKEDGQYRYTKGAISVLFNCKKSLVVTVYREQKIKKRLKRRRQRRKNCST